MKQSIQYGIVWLLGIALMSPLFGWSQGLVTGTVSDENGMPLPGATVVVEETNAGTTTDFDGNYQISASTGQTLVFSYVGYDKIDFFCWTLGENPSPEGFFNTQTPHRKTKS